MTAPGHLAPESASPLPLAGASLPEIVESYRATPGSSWVPGTVSRLLRSIGPEHLHGLATIVLTDSSTLRRGKTNRIRGRKYRTRDCLGFYHRSWRGQPAWIELVVDNIVARYPRPLLALSLVRDMVVSDTLFHEIGHHLHGSVASAARTSEGAANQWRDRLQRVHFRRQYWYLRPLVRLLARPLGWLASRSSSRAASHGESDRTRTRRR